MGKDFFVKHPEGRILLFALFLVVVFLVILGITAFQNPQTFNTMLSVTASNIIIGRIAGLTVGISGQMDTLVLMGFNFLLESIMVLLTYPLFVMSWKSLHVVSYKPIVDYLEESKKTAQKYQPMIKKYGEVGLILFVLTPLVMTGPVIGAFIGYIMGFSHLRTLLIVLSTTAAAVLGWTYLIKNFETTLILYSETLMTLATVAIVIFVLWYILKKKFFNHESPKGDESNPPY